LILRPFLLRRLKEKVEESLPRKKEIILYADMKEHQKHIQDHLVNKTLEVYMQNKGENGDLTCNLIHISKHGTVAFKQ
jgi:ATP-dependent DNA helicase